MIGDICVLVVDDSEFFAEMTADTLADDHGMDSYHATSASEALAVLSDVEVDCIVSDYEMPEADGLELKRRVEETHGDIPFILLTGRGDEETAAQAISAGVADYILKLEVVEDQQYQRLANRIEAAVTQRRAQRRYELLVENTPDAVAQVATSGEVLAANPAFADLADASRSALVGRDIVDVLPGDVAGEWLATGRAVVESGTTRRIESEVRDRSFQNVFVPVDIRTERDTFQLIARDVTERIERQRQLQRQNERLERFASVVSHDLRNPLETADMAATLLDEAFEDQPEQLAMIHDAHERMETIIDDVLTLAKQGQTVSEPQPVVLEEAAESVWRYVDTGTATLEADVPDAVLADRSRLEELLGNLFRNAVEHGSAETIRIETIDDGFFVADDGSGIPPDERETVFDAGYSTAETGTGFGLTIVDGISEAHDWDVAIEESTEGGTRFSFSDVDFA